MTFRVQLASTRCGCIGGLPGRRARWAARCFDTSAWPPRGSIIGPAQRELRQVFLLEADQRYPLARIRASNREAHNVPGRWSEVQTTRPQTPSQYEHSNPDSLPSAMRTFPVGEGTSAGWGWAVVLARRLSVDLCGCARSSAGGMIIRCRPPTQRAADRIARTSSSDAWAPLRDDSEGPGIEHVGPPTCGDSARGATGAAFAGMVRHTSFRSLFGSIRHEAESKSHAQVRPL